MFRDPIPSQSNPEGELMEGHVVVCFVVVVLVSLLGVAFVVPWMALRGGSQKGS